MSEHEREAGRRHMLAARERLLHVLHEIAQGVAEQALERCPYRTRDDSCTFRGACRNQIASARARRRCAGGALDPTPAAAADVAAAVAALTLDTTSSPTRFRS